MTEHPTAFFITFGLLGLGALYCIVGIIVLNVRSFLRSWWIAGNASETEQKGWIKYTWVFSAHCMDSSLRNPEGYWYTDYTKVNVPNQPGVVSSKRRECVTLWIKPEAVKELDKKFWPTTPGCHVPKISESAYHNEGVCCRCLHPCVEVCIEPATEETP